MLNTQEIRDLERRLKKYRGKKYINFFVSLIVIIAVVSISVYVSFFYKTGSIGKSASVAVDKNILVKEKSLEKKTKKQAAVELNNSIEPAKKKIKKEVKVSVVSDKNKSNTNNPTLTVEKTEQNSSKQIVQKEQTSDNKTDKSSYGNVLVLNTNFMNKIFAKMKQEKKSSFKDENINTIDKKQEAVQKNTSNNEVEKNETTTKKVVKPKIQKPKILISSTKIDKIKYLKDRYQATGKVLYAILLSKEFYKKHNYKLSLKWAMMANDIDSTNEDSWLLFAKNKIKLGYKEEAIKALNVYLKNYNSPKIRRLLYDIKNGAMK